jgi:hypothetical protein
MRKSRVSCVSQIVPGIMRKSRVSCVNHGYHAYHALYILQDIPDARTEALSSRPVDGSSQVLQSPSRRRRLVQICAVYCFEDADHGLWQAEVVARPTRLPALAQQKCSRIASSEWCLLGESEPCVSIIVGGNRAVEQASGRSRGRAGGRTSWRASERWSVWAALWARERASGWSAQRAGDGAGERASKCQRWVGGASERASERASG